MKPEDVKKEQELNEEELDNVSGGAAPVVTKETGPQLTPA
ncbi:MAG: class IIb bacteriocin, lactobin A/cerein 7B family [Prevotella sp.]|nr:class IIb bacteriocin, lactobin A/cerein 7B family [Prevotella sp.]MBO7537836.1 class IIb bacteriocin, lactobin A/cerein 7B family [Prevotella sp.]